ncbi:MAG TPA: trehalase family glycosidase [Candidatus Methylacidiphilales bacterium]
MKHAEKIPGTSGEASVDGHASEAPSNYFKTAKYSPAPLPIFEDTKEKLPSPIYEENPLYIRMYWKAWELAFRNFHEPTPENGFVSQFIDAAFNENIFLWDSCFLTMFCNYAHTLVPGIVTLDNFYAKQRDSGEICREIDRNSGIEFHAWLNRERVDLFSVVDKYSVVYVDRDIPQPPPFLTLDALNHPILAWAELESLRATGDQGRLKRIYDPLVRYYRALQKYLRQGNGLYITDWASMDNSPRNEPMKNGVAVDISSEMVMFASQLEEFARLLGRKNKAEAFRQEAAETAKLICEKMWDPKEKFFYDLKPNGESTGIKTIAGYWTLLAGVATHEQADALAEELNNPRTFGRPHRVPTLAADQSGYDEKGGYWRGSVWAPTDTMVIRGLQRYGKDTLARAIALNHLENIGAVFVKTGTFWENYSAEFVEPGIPAKGDFVGWTGIGPILYLIEFAIGIKADAMENRIVWNVNSPKRVGVEQFWFAGKTVNLVCEAAHGEGKRALQVFSDQPFTLLVNWAGRTAEMKVPANEKVSLQI